MTNQVGCNYYKASDWSKEKVALKKKGLYPKMMDSITMHIEISNLEQNENVPWLP